MRTLNTKTKRENSMKAKILAFVLTFALCTSQLCTFISPSSISADAIPIVTLGENLTDEQKSKIMEFFGTQMDSVEVMTVNNLDERKYLEGLISDDIIGTRTLSCSYILPTTSGGIIVKTANLTWVTDGMLANALLTCGVENCQVIATAPFEVSGTGALTGVMKAYEKSSGEVLEEEKKQLATEELVLTGELITDVLSGEEPITIGKDGETEEKEMTDVELSRYVVEMLNDMKVEALNGNLSKEKAQEIVEKRLKEYGIAVSEEMVNKLVDYLMSFSSEKYADTFKGAITNLTEQIKKGFDININFNIGGKIEADESLSKFEQLWQNILTWFKYIFGNVKINVSLEGVGDKVGSIFDKVNTAIIPYDETTSETEDTEKVSEESVSVADDTVKGEDEEDNTLGLVEEKEDGAEPIEPSEPAEPTEPNTFTDENGLDEIVEENNSERN